MTSLESAKFLALSGSISIFFSAWIGVIMLFPRRPNRDAGEAGGVNFKQIGAAHIDWIMLGLMQGLAGLLILLFAITPAPYVLWLMAFGAWLNPLPYVFRAFGINAFVFAGGPVQRSAATLGGLSSTAILVSWSLIFLSIASR
ncbi:hypothetical protein ASE06_15805 [Sphingopyxis sp. Root214]|nr:hypothetical protein ASD73_13460 [Sphingopyxis sp. Root154]KRC07942.1 hypothetical protein ASE06_15805 [Sphingopyxis sp. Root214]